MKNYGTTSSTVSLRVTSRSKGLGDFTTGLHVWGGSSSDPTVSGRESVTVQARDVIASLPILWWKLATDEVDPSAAGVMEGVGLSQAYGLSAVEFDSSGLPMAPVPTESISFRLHGSKLELVSGTRKLGVFDQARFEIEPRLEWFLTLGKTLAVVIETPSKTFAASITSDRLAPRVLVHEGITTMPAFNAVVEHSERWKPVGLGNVSLFAGQEDAPDHHTRTYVANASTTDLPDRLSYIGRCIACNANADSREHCVPNWIAKDQGVKPVVAPVFCLTCNNHFGDALEKPLADDARAGRLSETVDSDVFARWALKTAFVLSAACDVGIETEWMHILRAGGIPKDFQVFAETDCEMEVGYQFSVTYFSRGARNLGYYLFTFAMNGLVTVVLRYPSSLLEIPGMARVRPPLARDARASRIDATLLHDSLVELMTGHRIYRTDSERNSKQR